MNMVLVKAVLLSATAASSITAAHAQAAPSGDNPAQNESSASNDEIVVTAQRRSERLRDVPISVTAINSEQAELAGVTSVTNLPAVVPSMTMMVSVSGYTPFLRGVGSSQTGAAPNEEQPVATYVDGVYIAAPSAAATFEFNNIERVEVLKGPQGTLFGRNATGGVIQIVTKDPQQEFGGKVSLGYGNYDTVSGKAYLTGGLAEGVAADIAVVYENRDNGFGRNFTTGLPTFTQNSLALRSSVLLTPTETTRIRISGDYSRVKGNGPEFQKPEGVIGVDGVSTYPGPFNGLGENPIYTHIEQGGVSAHITQEVGNVELVSISAYRKLDGYVDWDQDMTPLRLVAAQFNLAQETFSQELQIQSRGSSKLEWMVGGYYYHGKGGYDPQIIYGRTITSGLQTTDSYSAFGQATLAVAENTKVTAGLRFTTEKQGIHWIQRSEPTGALQFDGRDSISTNKLTWRLVVAQALTPDVNLYASYNRGTHSGGFTSGGPGTPAYKPEVLDAFEVGLKSRLFDGMLDLNMAGFYYDYSNMHVKTLLEGVTQTQNAATARIYGFDADFNLRLSRSFSLSGGVGLVHGRFTDFKNSQAISATGVRTSIDATDNETPVTPPFTGNISANYTTPVAGGDFFASATLSHSAGSYATADNRLRVPSYTLLNGAIGWRTSDNGLEVRLWAKNLTNETYYQYRLEQSTVGDGQVQAPPRTYGITLSTQF